MEEYSSKIVNKERCTGSTTLEILLAFSVLFLILLQLSSWKNK